MYVVIFDWSKDIIALQKLRLDTTFKLSSLIYKPYIIVVNNNDIFVQFRTDGNESIFYV